MILDCFRFAYYALWLAWKNSQHHLKQSNVTRKPTCIFPRISQVARVRTCVVIGSCDTSVLVFTTLIWKLALDEMINQNRQNSNTCYLNWYFLLALLWLTTCCFVYFLPGLLGGSLRHIGKINFYRTVPEGSSVDLSCELNNSTVDVRLWLLRSGGKFTPRKGVVKYGQLFTLHGVSNKKQGSYLCQARSRGFSKYIGRIIVTPRLQSNVKSL